MKFLIFSFDGTGKNARAAEQEENFGGKLSDNNITNVIKLHLMCGGNLHLDGPNYGHSTQKNVDRAFYYPGIGTFGNEIQQYLNMAFAPEDLDVAHVLSLAHTDLLNNLPDDPNDLVILITGYSRGAALARRFATLVHRYFESTEDSPTEPFIYLSVWDTVASIGRPDLSTDQRPEFRVVFEEGNTLSKSVRQANHMVALDEKRRLFQPTLMNYDPERVTEVWFVGAHGDIGGGYLKDGLSDITLQHTFEWLQFMTETQGLPEIDLALPTEAMLDNACPTDIRTIISKDDLTISPNPMGVSHQQDRLPIIEWITLYDRICCVINNDKIDESIPPLIHRSVPVRIYRDQRYNPISLSRMSTEHKIWTSFCVPVAAFTPYIGIHRHHQLTQHTWLRLEPEQFTKIMVEADRKYNHSGIQAKAGEVYRVTVADDQKWHDAAIQCSADGWNKDDIEEGWQEIFIAGTEHLRRVPDVNWFCLCAAIGTARNSYMEVGKNKEIQAILTGELTFFANDLESRYFNNWGNIEVVVERLS